MEPKLSIKFRLFTPSAAVQPAPIQLQSKITSLISFWNQVTHAAPTF